MARTGRPAKPIEQHEAEGTLRPYHAQKAIRTPGEKRPRCPRYITSEKARAAFLALVKDLWDAGIVDAADTALVATAALHLATAIEAGEIIEKTALVVPVTRGGYNGQPERKSIEANPAQRIQRDALTEFRQCCDLLGIGPTARARLANMGVKPHEGKPLPGIGAKPTPLRVVNGGEE